MFRFFRKIRQRLLAENRLGDYLAFMTSGADKILRNEPWFDSREQAQILADRVYLNTLTYHAVPLQLLNAEYTRKQEELQRLIQIVENEIQRIE